MVTKDQAIQLIVKNNVIDTPGFKSLYFHRPPNFVFEAGDWIDLAFEGKKPNGGITYSISSSPTESDIRISYREGISEFKRSLQAAVQGDKLRIVQYGNDYDFQLKRNRSSMLIAGGIGIAPFRSILKQMYDDKDKNDVTLLYLNQSENFLFKDEIDMWTSTLRNVSVSYICTKDINRKKREKLILSLVKNHNQNFYISGTPAMVESNEHLLIDNGVNVRNIRIDSFGGY